MFVLTNAEFETVVSDKSNWLKAAARQRMKSDPSGSLTMEEINGYITARKYSGDSESVRWLTNLAVMSKNGKLARARSGSLTWKDHLEDVRARKTAGEIAFDIGDHIRCKESGKYGAVVDYDPKEKQYVVVFDPFQIKTYKKDEMERIAQADANLPPSIQELTAPKVQDMLDQTVIHGTLREEDLIPAFLEVLQQFDAATANTLAQEYEGIKTDQEQVSMFLNETLFDALNNLAPEGYYFGSHPGDGSDFGFWKEEV